MAELRVARVWRYDAAVRSPPGRRMRFRRRWTTWRPAPSLWVQEVDARGRPYEWHVLTRTTRWSHAWSDLIHELRARQAHRG